MYVLFISFGFILTCLYALHENNKKFDMIDFIISLIYFHKSNTVVLKNSIHVTHLPSKDIPRELTQEKTETVNKEIKRNMSNPSQQSKSKRRHCKNKKGNHNKKTRSKFANNQLFAVDTSEQEIQVTHHHSDDGQVPCLSDSESTVGSIESPCLSTTSLPKENHHYYSLFSTGFDFGVSPIMTAPQEQKFHYRHLSFQDRIPSVDNIGKKTFHKRSLLDMLDQDQQAQTTITPIAFSYFDDMMMSTSLYKYH